MAAGFELAVGSAGEDDWNVFSGVGVAIADARAEEDHRVVEDVGVAFGEALQCLEKVGELGGVPGVDALVLVELFLVAFVVGDGVVTSADAIKEGEVFSGDGVAKHEGGDAGGVGPEGEGDEVEHEACVLGVVDALDGAEAFFVSSHGGANAFVEGGELACGLFADVLAGSDLGGFVFNAAFDFADAFEVLLELVLVLDAEGSLEGVGVVDDDVDDGLVIGLAFAVFVGVAEESVEGALRVDFAGEGNVGLLPRDVGAVEPGEIDIAVNARGDGFGTEFHGRKLGLAADGFGGELVDGDAVCGDV